MMAQRWNPESLPTRRRHPALAVPRKNRRAQWAPDGRTLHLMDIENLMGGPLRGLSAMDFAVRAYEEIVGIQPGDHVVIACNGRLAMGAGLALPGSRLIVGHGPDGADLALLRSATDMDWVAARYDRVNVASGDGIFTQLVNELSRRGIPVGVISRPSALAWTLAHEATFVVYLTDTPNDALAA